MFSRALAFLFEFWHAWVSPWLPAACRFEPTCSVYAAQALRKFGLLKGLVLSFKRLLACHPYSRHSGFDPVP